MACVDAYEELCAAFTKVCVRESAELTLQNDLEGIPEKGKGSLSMGGVSVEQLRTHLQHAEAVGVSGPVIEQAREHLKVLQTLRLKVHFQHQTRLIQLIDPAAANFSDVHEQLYAFCVEQALLTHGAVPHGRELRVRYKDNDGDVISVMNDADWALMLSETLSPGAVGGSSSRRLDLFCDFADLPNADAVERAPRAVSQQSRQNVAEPSAAKPVTAAAPTAAPDGTRSPGMTRSAELRLAAARARSAGVQRRTGTAAFAPRSRSGVGRTTRPRTQPASPPPGEDSAAPTNIRREGRSGPRGERAATRADGGNGRMDDTEPAESSTETHMQPPVRPTVHKNILDGAKSWSELSPTGGDGGAYTALHSAPPQHAAAHSSAESRSSTAPLSAETQTSTTMPSHSPTPAASLAPTALALPPRPNPNATGGPAGVHNGRSTTPHRRASRRGSHGDPSQSPNDAQHSRSTQDLLQEVSRLQEENEVAMYKRTNSHGG